MKDSHTFRRHLRRLTISSCFLALAFVLPFATGQIPRIGNMLCPMHLPVMMCGYLCGPVWGAVVGVVAPLLRSLLVGQPSPLMPRGIAMAAELCAYGLSVGLLGYWLRTAASRNKKTAMAAAYLSLVGSMVFGRIVWGLTQYGLATAMNSAFLWADFWTRGVVNAIPGMILQLILFPTLTPVLARLPVVRSLQQGNGHGGTS